MLQQILYPRRVQRSNEEKEGWKEGLIREAVGLHFLLAVIFLTEGCYGGCGCCGLTTSENEPQKSDEEDILIEFSGYMGIRGETRPWKANCSLYIYGQSNFF